MKTILFILLAFQLTASAQPETVTLKQYIDMRIDLQKEFNDKVNQVQFDNIKDNINKANASMEKRLDGINEFRGQLKDQAGTFITRAELWGYIIGIMGMVFGFINISRKRTAEKRQP